MTLPYAAFDKNKAMPKGQPHRIYGVWGDAFLQDRIITALMGWNLDDSSSDFNVDILDGEGLKIGDVWGITSNLPFLSDRRVVLVKRAEKMKDIGGSGDESGRKKKTSAKASAKAAPALSPGEKFRTEVENLPPTTLLILARTPETPEPGDRPGERCLNAALDKVIEENGLLVNCVVPAKNSGMATALVENEASERGIPLARDAAAHLVERCGFDLAHLVSELEKCGLSAGVGRPVTNTIIDEMTQPALHNTVFDLTDALGTRSGAKAVQSMRELFAREVPKEVVVQMILRHLRQLLQARTFLDANLPLDASLVRRLPQSLAAQLPEGKDNLAVALQSQGWLGQRLGSQARRFTVPQIQRAFELVLEADMAIKGIEGDGGFGSSEENARASLELLVARLCSL